MRTGLSWVALVSALVGAGAGTAWGQVPGNLGGYSGTYGAPGVSQPGLPGMVGPGGLAAPQTGTMPPGISNGGYGAPQSNGYVYGTYPGLNPGTGTGALPQTGVTGAAPSLGLGITQSPAPGVPGLFAAPGDTSSTGAQSPTGLGSPQIFNPGGGPGQAPAGPTGVGGGF